MADPPAPLPAETVLAEMTWLRALVRRLVRDAHAAEDVVQDTWVARLREDSHDLEGPRLRAWLATVALNFARRRHRDDSMRRGHEEAAGLEKRAEERDEVERLRQQRMIADLVLELREPYRSAVLLRFQRGSSYASIAGRQGVTQEAARKRVSRGIAMLRARLDDKADGRAGAWSLPLAQLFNLGAPRGTTLLTKVLLMGTKAIVAAAAIAVGAVWWISLGGGARDGLSGSAQALEVGQAIEGSEDSPARREVPRAEQDSPIASPGLEPLLVTVRSEDGQAAGGASVLLLVEGRKTVRMTTDAQGRVRFEHAAAPGYIAAHAASRRSVVLALEEVTGERELVLRPGRRVSGRLLVDGAPPRKPLRLILWGVEEPARLLPDAIVDVAPDRLRPDRFGSLVTDIDGSFAFEGLAAGWSGHIALPSTHWFAEAPAGTSMRTGDEDLLLLSEPVEGLILNTISLPCVRGRVVWADSGAPIARAQVSVFVELWDDHTSPSLGRLTDDDGRFAIGVYPASEAARSAWPRTELGFEHVQFSVSVRDGSPLRLEYDGLDLEPDGDLGEIRIERGRQLHFVVRDPGGEPIQGAVALGRSLSKRTDREGRGFLGGLPPEADVLLVGAPGRRVMRLPVGAGGTSADDPVEFVLPAGNRLEIRVVAPDGGVPRDLRVRLSSDRPLYEGADVWAGRGGRQGGAHYDRASNWEAVGTVRPSLDESGTVHLSGFRDDLPLHLEVLDRFEQLLVEEHFIGPGNAELLTRTVRLPTSPLGLAARVVDVGGSPLPNAEVWFWVGGSGKRAISDQDGTYEFGGLHPTSRPGMLVVSLPGFATRRVEGIDVSSAATLPEVVLERGRSVRVTVVDESGAAVKNNVTARADGFEPVYSVPVAAGVVRLDIVPPVATTLQLSHGWRLYEQPLAPATTEARFVLPVHGTLWLFAPTEAPVYEQGSLSARITSLDGPGVDRSVDFDQEGERALKGGPHELVPGHYRVRLEHTWWTGEGQRAEHLPGEWEFEIRAREDTRLRLGD